MVKFIRKNWKFFLFPIVFICIILIDTSFGIPKELTLFKLFFFSLLHYIFVWRTKYVFEADISQHYAALKLEYESKRRIQPLLTTVQSKVLFWVYLLISLYFLVHPSPLLWGWQFLFLGVFFLDLSSEVYSYQNTNPDFNKIKVPYSLQQFRFFPGVFFKRLVTLGPICAKTGSAVVAGAGFSEMGYPMLTEGLNKPGIITKYYVNNWMYDDLIVPARTRADICYEGIWHGYEEDVANGVRTDNPLKKRDLNIRTLKDITSLGLSKEDSILFPYDLKDDLQKG